jgi:hypothetical protein
VATVFRPLAQDATQRQGGLHLVRDGGHLSWRKISAKRIVDPQNVTSAPPTMITSEAWLTLSRQRVEKTK